MNKWADSKNSHPVALKTLRSFLNHRRPVRAGAMQARLKNLRDIGTVLVQLETSSPGASRGFEISLDGWSVVHDLYVLVDEIDLFPVDWDIVELVTEIWMMESNQRHEISDNEMYLKLLTHFIPTEVFGFDCPEEMAEEPAVHLLAILFESPGGPESDALQKGAAASRLLELAGISRPALAAWHQNRWDAAWFRLDQIELHPDRYPPGIRVLPTLVRWVTPGLATGNPLLDTSLFSEDVHPIFPVDHYGYITVSWDSHFHHANWFRWEQDLDAVRQAWLEAKAVLSVRERLSAWCLHDEEGLRQLALFLMEGEEGTVNLAQACPRAGKIKP